MNQSSDLIWSTPWHALLKTLAQGLRPEYDAHPNAPNGGAVAPGVTQASWLGRTRAFGVQVSDA